MGLGGVPEWPNGTALKAVAGSDVSRGFESRPLCVTASSDALPGGAPAPGPVDFRVSRRLVVRLMGVLVVGAGLLVCAAVVVVALLGLPRVLLTTVVVVLGLVVVVGLGLLARRGYVVRLTAEGYRIRFVRGAGVSRARWADVADAVTAQVAGSRCVVLRLKDGRSSTVPVDLLEAPAEEFVAAVRASLAGRFSTRPGDR